MSIIQRTTDHRTPRLLAFCILVTLCLGAAAWFAWQNRTIATDHFLIADGIHINTSEILIPKPAPPDEG